MKARHRLGSSLQRVRKRSTRAPSSLVTQSLPRHQKTDLPEILQQHLRLSPSPPDVLGGSPPRQSPTTHRHASTLDSRPRRSRARTEVVNPYHTPPRSAARPSQSGLLYSSLTRNIDIELLARAGPPPDIAPQPPRNRITGTSTPPDITSSPSNTWQAML